MNNKKLIRLTESDLHRIVRESVNKVLREAQLNELDPRTYASARDKAIERGELERGNKFGDAAAKAWNKQYGIHNFRRKKTNYGKDARDTNVGVTYDLNGNYNAYAREDFDTGFEEGSYYPRDDRGFVRTGKWGNGKTTANEFTYDRQKGIPEFTKNLMSKDGVNVLKQMQNGTGKYDPNNGWQ